jgi:hypothetical protein
VLTSVLASCSRTPEHSIVNAKRLIVPPNEDLGEAVAGLKFRGTFTLETHGEPVLVTDPIYLGDIYNSKGDEKAVYVREHGMLLVDFGGDTGGPVWWQAPYLLMPISMHYKDGEPKPKEGVAVLAEEVACDSGSFVFLPVTSELPLSLQRQIEEVVQKRNGALLRLPEGKYSFFYEQFDPPKPNMVGLYRNIVARKD